MQQLLTVLNQSLVIASRNFILVYVILLSLLLFGWLTPDAGLPRWNLNWLLLFGVLLLLFSAIMAGWFNMIAQACQRFIHPASQSGKPTLLSASSLSLIQSFLPGIGQFFFPITGGFLIQGLVLLLLFSMIQPLWTANYETLQHLTQIPPEQRQAAIEALTMAQQVNIGQLFLAILLDFAAFIGFNLLFSLWPAFIIYYGDHPIQAYWRSFTQYFRDPFGLLGLNVFFILLGAALYLLTALSILLSVPLLYLLFQMFFLLALIYMVIGGFVYVYHAVGKPTRPLKENTPPTSSDQSASGQ